MKNLNPAPSPQEIVMTILNDHNKIYLEIDINGIKVNGLLDTGATISVLGSDSEIIWNKGNNEQNNSSVITANGQPMNCKGKINAKLKFKGTERHIKFMIIPEVTERIILGMNFFHAFKMKISNDQCNVISANMKEDQTNEVILSSEQKARMDEAIKTFLFSTDTFVGCQTQIKHHIDTADCQPICQRPYTYSPHIEELMKVEIDRWLLLDYIEQANTDWRHPLVPIMKKNGKVRICLDARKLNEVTKRDTYISPDLNVIFRRFPHANYFFSVDLTDAFMQTELTQESKEKTAFGISGKGTFQYKRMPFGLKNSAATQSRVMNKIIGEDLEPKVFHYLDDIVIAAMDIDELIDLIKIVAKRLKDNNLTVNPDKLEGPCTKIKFIGRVFDCDGQHPDEAKIDVINNLQIPKTVKEVRSLVGLVTWYAHFIKDFSSLMAPITSLIKKKAQKVQWTEEADQAFIKIKKVLTSEPILRPPSYDKPFLIQCDASQVGIGAVLVQVDENSKEYAISYYSHKLSKDEQKYHAYERECLAVLKALDHFKPYVYLQPLVIITDHHSLTQTLNYKGKSGRLLRWSLMLQPHAHQIVHRSGSQMVVADLLSRARIESQQYDADEFQHYKINMITPIEIDGIPIPQEEFLSPINPDIHEYESLRRNVREHPQGVLCYKLDDNNRLLVKKGKMNEWKVIPHPTQKNQIIDWAHDETLHGGIDKTLSKIQEKFYWKHMKGTVTHIIRGCMKCAQTKVPNYCHRGLMSPFRVPNKVGEEIQIDFKGPFPASRHHRYRFIIVAQEALSRFLIAECIVKSNVENTIKFLNDKVLPIFPELKRIKHDRGSQFLSNAFQEFLRNKNIESISTAAYAPHQNPVERANRVIGDALTLCMLQNPETHDNWNVFIEMIVAKINNRKHDATKLAPHKVVYGCTMNNQNQVPINDENHRKLIELAYSNSRKSYESRKLEYNKHATRREFDIGLWVMAKYRTLSSSSHNWMKKLAAKYQPVKIIKKLGHNTYEVEDVFRAKHIIDVRSINNIVPEINERLQANDTDNEESDTD